MDNRYLELKDKFMRLNLEVNKIDRDNMQLLADVAAYSRFEMLRKIAKALIKINNKVDIWFLGMIKKAEKKALKK